MQESQNIDCRFISEVDDKFISDFMMVENAVFGDYYTREYFKHKFVDNIYGESVLAVVYNENNQPIAARALWRNDIEGKPSYQPGDTCVLEEARGKGVFSKMTMKAISKLPKDAIIYNFPNQNSFPGYIKLGWKEKCRYHLVLLTNKAYEQEHPGIIDDIYFDWWIKDHPNVRSYRRRNKYYVISPHSRKHCYLVVGAISKKNAEKIKPLKKRGLIFFKSSKETWYNRKFATGHAVSTSEEIAYIPTWKIDAL